MRGSCIGSCVGQWWHASVVDRPMQSALDTATTTGAMYSVTVRMNNVSSKLLSESNAGTQLVYCITQSHTFSRRGGGGFLVYKTAAICMGS